MSSDAEHLRWIAGRLDMVHGDPPQADFLIRLREIADSLDNSLGGRQQETMLGSALSKMPSALETAEFVRLAIRDNEAVTHAVRGAVMLRQMQLRGDDRTSDLAFGLYLEGR